MSNEWKVESSMVVEPVETTLDPVKSKKVKSKKHKIGNTNASVCMKFR